uniref:Uncharacterized protein n=1 Tax=Cacopsylla melanoneura TaxID=428564 RepID=A0A8D8XFL7_9HEMI
MTLPILKFDDKYDFLICFCQPAKNEQFRHNGPETKFCFVNVIWVTFLFFRIFHFHVLLIFFLFVPLFSSSIAFSFHLSNVWPDVLFNVLLDLISTTKFWKKLCG